MAFIPGASINGKFKPYNQMTTEELEQLVYKSQIKKMVLLLLSSSFIAAAVILVSI